MATQASAAGLLIIQSQHRTAYDQAVRLLQNNCARDAVTLVMSDYAEFDLERLVREERPKVVIAVGDQALSEARQLRRTPVTYSMALNTHGSPRDNITGVTMHVAPENYLKLFRKLRLHRIGVIYDAKKSGAYLQRARQAAAAFGIELISREVRSPREVTTALTSLNESRIGGIWMLPDSTAVSAENVDAYFLFGQQQHLPIISFARGYLAKGAVAVLELSKEALAEQSCAQIKQLHSNRSASELPDEDINRADLFTNDSVAAKLNLKIADISQLFPPRE